MQTATAPTSAYEAFVQGQGTPEFSPVDLHSPHFFVQMGWTAINVDTPAIVNRRLLRGEITPCLSFRQKAHLMEIPDGALIEGSKELDRDNREVWGKYWRYAHHESERLVHLEAATERKDGIYEIRSLKDNVNLYKDVNLNALFYPQGLTDLPEKNAEMIKHLRERMDAIQADPPMDVIKNQYYVPIIVQIGRELIAATALAEKYQLARLRYSHSCMKLAPKEPEHKRDYDLVDEEMLVRTGEPRLHDSEKRASNALEILARGGGVDGSIAILVEAQREQNALLRAQMETQNAQLSVALEQSRQQQTLIFQLLGRQGQVTLPADVILPDGDDDTSTDSPDDNGDRPKRLPKLSPNYVPPKKPTV